MTKNNEPTCKLTIDECVGLHKQLLHDWIPPDNEECHRAFKKIEQFLDELTNGTDKEVRSDSK